jgi:hypothetical protein
MNKKPMRDKHDDSKSAELARRTACKKRDDPENDVVREYLEWVRSSSTWQTLADAFFDGKGYGRLDDSLNLEDGKKQTNRKLNSHDTDQTEHILCANKHDDQGEDSPVTHS